MDHLKDIPWEIVMTTTEMLLGGLFGLLLLTIKFPAARYLGRLLLSYLLLLIPVLIIGLESTRWGFIILIVISLYLYAIVFFSQKTRLSYLHILPVALGGALFWVDDWVLTIFSAVTVVFYLVLVIRTMRAQGIQKGISWFSNPGARLGWFRNFVIINVFCVGYLFFLGISNSMVTQIIILLVITYALYQVMRESTFFTPIPLGNKYQKSTLSPEIKSSILNKLDIVLGKQKFYLRDDASLSALAKELGATTHHLSQVLNESLKISFQDLLARYRVREACRLLRSKDQQQVKIENIATMVGYNSKSAFNTAFKKRTGLTPSEYKDAKVVRTYGEERLTERKAPLQERSTFLLNQVFNFKMNSDMIQDFFKMFSRNVKRNAFFSLLNVLGLTVGFTCSILIYLFISDELSYDTEIQGYDRIYRIAWMNDNPQTRTPHPMAQAMVNDFPEVEAAVSLSPWYGNGLSKEFVRVKNVKSNILFEEPDFYFADSAFLDVFQLKIIEGDMDALSKPFSLVITEPMARKYFGDESAIGQELELNDMSISVSAVVEPMPKNAHFHFQAIIPYVTLKQINPRDSWMKWEDFGHFNYIRLKENVEASTIESKIPKWISGYVDWDQSYIDRLLSGEFSFDLQPIADIHLYSHLRWELESNGNVLYIHILTVTLFFLILIASINYVNLTTAKSIERAKEIGIRKTLGAISRNLSVQFYLESVLFCTIAMVLSLGLAFLLLDSFNFLSGKQFSWTMIMNTSFILRAFGLSILIGLMAGFYPAMVLSDFKPVEVLKGKLTTQSKGVKMRSFLVIMQFTVSAILISGSLIIFRQIQYMKDKELGFDQKAIISIDIPTSIEYGGLNMAAVYAVQQKIESLAGVMSTTMMSNIPGGQFNQHPYYAEKDPQNKVDFINIMVDFGVEEVLGLEVMAGRSFDSSIPSDSVKSYVINETGSKRLNLKNPIGETLVFAGAGDSFSGKIVGVVRDFHFKSMHEPIEPLAMVVQPLGVSHMLVKFDGNQYGSIISQIEVIYEELNKDLPFEYHFLDQQLAGLYDSEMKTLSIFSLFAGIALILACLGLLGMAIAMLNQRIKEVGMRKILGASAVQIMQLIFGQFLILIGIALLIGLPVSSIVMQGWMNEFSYRAPFGIMPFVCSTLILLFVAAISVSSAVIKIAFSNPIEALRYE
ncbi:MAG: putative ABC transport system permease protein [Cyclobacteriaceae bacterium]